MLTKRILLEYISDLWSEANILEERIEELEKTLKSKPATKEKKKPGRPKGSKSKDK